MYINFNTLFLEIVFESFKNISKQKSELDPAIFMTVPWVSLSTCFEKMNGNFEQLNDPDMLMFIDEAPIIGKNALLYSCTNISNPKCPDYATKLRFKTIVYMDSKNFCGWAMKLLHPMGCFEPIVLT